MGKSWLVVLTLFSDLTYARPPAITLRYSDVFDSWCSRQTGVEITNQARDRLVRAFPGLQTAWDNLGPALLSETERVVGRSFLQGEMIGTVFLCRNTPSMSIPLLVNGNWFVSDSPQSLDRVVDIVYHELLHTYLVDNYPDLLTSPLLTKYRSEDPGVIAHLHLMATQKAVYRALGLESRIESLIDFDSNKYGGAYKRSWDIVNAEGEYKFIAELTEPGSPDLQTR